MIIGWREWLTLPKIGIPYIKAKVDTGAKTSSLHAFDIVPFEKDGQKYISFNVHPMQGNEDVVIACTAPLVDKRKVMNSGGQSQKRYVVTTVLQIGGKSWDIELTLTNRDVMKFRMLLGRDAMKGRLVVDPQLSLQAGSYKVANLYNHNSSKSTEK
ncbi:MAG: ATP-dependent zinc protease [Pseudodesulfovibrio sp.]|nr:ATP-dependent zinc protease [Pseudodesulfovibrio sp.]